MTETTQVNATKNPATPVVSATRNYRRGGRPAMSAGDIKARQINLRLTEREYADVIIRAENAGLKPIDYARVALTGARIQGVQKINREAYSELAKIGTNINQLARQANGGQIQNIPPEVLNALFYKIQEMRKALLGENE